MFKRIKITSNFNKNASLCYKNFSILEEILKIKLLGGNYKSSKVLGANKSILLKESPFHYPTAKKILNNKSQLISLSSEYVINGNYLKKNLTFFKLKSFTSYDKNNLNSLYTPSSTIVSTFIDYTPVI